MKSIVVDGLLLLAVLSAWLGAAGFGRLTAALDRLHCVTFVYVGCGIPLVLAVFVEDGLSTRAFKVTLLLIVAIISGASANQAAARAIFTRDEAGERM